jgi:hypothetical protein
MAQSTVEGGDDSLPFAQFGAMVVAVSEVVSYVDPGFNVVDDTAICVAVKSWFE